MVDMVAVANLLVCVGIVWTCIVRLRTDLCRLNLLQRFKYSVLLTGGLIAGLPNLFFGEEAVKSTLIMSVSILIYLFTDVLIWRDRKWVFLLKVLSKV